MRDVIYALKSRNVNLMLKLDGCVKQDATGVCYYSAPKNALNMLELNPEEKERLVKTEQASGKYDCIIVDMPFAFDDSAIKLLNMASNIVWVCDGEELSENKVKAAYDSINIVEQEKDTRILDRVKIVYNKFSNKTGHQLTDIPIDSIGGFPKIEHAPVNVVVSSISQNNMFDALA